MHGPPLFITNGQIKCTCAFLFGCIKKSLGLVFAIGLASAISKKESKRRRWGCGFDVSKAKPPNFRVGGKLGTSNWTNQNQPEHIHTHVHHTYVCVFFTIQPWASLLLWSNYMYNTKRNLIPHDFNLLIQKYIYIQSSCGQATSSLVSVR